VQLDKNELNEIVQAAVDATINRLIEKGLLVVNANANANVTAKGGTRLKNANANPSEKSAYQQTEALLYNYLNFKKIINQKKQEIEDIKKYGVLQGGSAVVMYGGNKSGHPQGIVLDEERKASAIKNIEKSMESTVQAIALIDSCMKTLVNDPYYKVLEMRYFEGRTQEDIAVEFNCSQQNIAYHKSRLVKELSIKLFPDKVVNEYFN
jgi:RNA polymerase sigma factor (sigma-70 family)